MMMPLIFPLLFAASIGLPGGPPVGMDYLAYDPATDRIWVPAGNTGNVDVIDLPTGKVTPLGGFPTIPSQHAGRPNMGPSSATVGEDVVWVGNRGDNKLCAFDSRTLKKRACVQLSSMPDGLAYVASTHELWVTTPHNHTITIVDVKGSRPGAPVEIKLDGSPEGYAVDGGRNIFYTNLEDKDRTAALDLHDHHVLQTWPSGCGEDGPKGLAVEPEHGCPFDCGLCTEHEQHTCLGVLEITSSCNLECPMCYASSGPGGRRDHLRVRRDLCGQGAGGGLRAGHQHDRSRAVPQPRHRAARLSARTSHA
jgi:hypothetical protein